MGLKRFIKRKIIQHKLRERREKDFFEGIERLERLKNLKFEHEEAIKKQDTEKLRELIKLIQKNLRSLREHIKYAEKNEMPQRAESCKAREQQLIGYRTQILQHLSRTEREKKFREN